jgi:hypothetical protein
MNNMKKVTNKANRYELIISHVFNKYYEPGTTEFDFLRTDFTEAASQLGLDQVENLGDLIYSFRFRSALPQEITRTATEGKEWIIRLAGKAKYRFVLTKVNRFLPRPDAFQIKIPDATPQIVARHAGGDEQALLTKVRYNRLIDTFLRVTAYHLQSHLRTTVADLGQIETDDIYLGVRNTGQQFVIPVQAKVGNDEIGVVQIEQDLALCKQAFPDLSARPIAVQFKSDKQGEVIVMFELVLVGDEVKVVDERHYRLVSADQIEKTDLEQMANLD